jgi:hypothetical protein
MDKTAKILLVLIASGLWANIVVSQLGPRVAFAQDYAQGSGGCCRCPATTSRA